MAALFRLKIMEMIGRIGLKPYTALPRPLIIIGIM